MKKNFLIVGGTSGIGYDVSNKLDEKKYNIYVVGRKIRLPKSNKINYLLYDILKNADLKKFYKRLIKIKKIHLVLYCVGGSLGVENLDYKNCLKVWNTNIGIPISINNFLIQNKILNKQSVTLMFSSRAADNNSGKPAYNMSKKYLEKFIENSSKFYKKKQIYYKCIKPSIVISTGNNWFKCKLENIKKYKFYVKKYNKNGIEINSSHIYKKIINIIKNKKSSKLIYEI